MDNGRKRKRALVGVEAELMLIDQQGNPLHKADALIEKMKTHYPKNEIQKECAHHMLEIASLPFEEVQDTIYNLVARMDKLYEMAKSTHTFLYPLATYPGKIAPKMRKDFHYSLKERIIGKNRFQDSGRCYGVHCHYTLPWGVLDKNKKLKVMRDSRYLHSTIHLYNLMIAMDPVFITLMASSPFYQGKYIGKSSRVIMYRGGGAFKSRQGVYAKLQHFGGLPSYQQTATDLLLHDRKRHEKWKRLVRSVLQPNEVLPVFTSIHQTAWNPVRINPIGTLEHRGGDMNLPSRITATAILMKYFLHGIQEQGIHIEPADLAVFEPFTLEEETIYIAPFTMVKNYLQPKAAFDGFDNDNVHLYVSRFLKLAEKFVPPDRRAFLEPFKESVEEKKSLSDRILDFVKSPERNEEISQDTASEIAFHFSLELEKDLRRIKRLLEKTKN